MPVFPHRYPSYPRGGNTSNFSSTYITTTSSSTRSLDRVTSATVVSGGHLRLEMLLQIMEMIVRMGKGMGVGIRGRRTTYSLLRQLRSQSKHPRLIQIMNPARFHLHAHILTHTRIHTPPKSHSVPSFTTSPFPPSSTTPSTAAAT